MKNSTYDVVVAFTSNTVVACSCTCKAGSNNNEKIICVHILPVIYQMTQIMFQGLNQHLLVKFTIFLKRSTDTIQTEHNNNTELLTAINFIIASDKGKLLNTIIEHDNINGLLQSCYDVGTERRRLVTFDQNIPPPKLGPLRELDLSSSVMKAKRVIMQQQNDNVRISTNDQNNETKISNDIGTETYLKICKLIVGIFSHLRSQFSTVTELIGFKLLESRSQRFCVLKPTQKTKEDLKQIIKLANSIERPIKQRGVRQQQEQVTNLPETRRKEKKNHRSYKHCSVCGRSSSTDTDATFTVVPFPCCPPTSNATDGDRRKYAIRLYRRNTYLNRLDLQNKKTTKFIYFCEKNELQKELFEIEWKNKKDKYNTFKTYIKVPVDTTIKRTRLNSQHVRQVSIHGNTGLKRKSCDLEKDEYKQQSKRRCNFRNCFANLSEINIKLKKIPGPEGDYTTNDTTSNAKRRQIAIRKTLRTECLRRIGVNVNDMRKDIRICNQHKTERTDMLVNWIDKKNNTRSEKLSVNLPTSMTTLATTTRRGNGTGIARYINRQIDTATNLANSGDDQAAYRLMMLRMYNESNFTCDSFFDRNRIEVIRDTKTKRGKKVTVRFDDVDDGMTKTRTGFPSFATMLSFTSIVCDGDLSKMTATITTFTWLEEWFMFYEIIYGKSVCRWIDVQEKYNISSCSARINFDNKLDQVISTRKRWPMFATYLEDVTFRDREKWRSYDNQRVIMYDNTNVPICQPSCADSQRRTYSQYYSGNVAKGAVFIQPCGWMGCHELWQGAVSDSEYMQRGQVFHTLNKYLATCDVDTQDKKFTIVLDKGYRTVSDAWQNGNHFTLQPTFASSDTRFTTSQTLLTSTVAADRAGNERAVRYAKTSEYIKRGLLNNESCKRMSDVWLAWGFQVNFMYRPVH